MEKIIVTGATSMMGTALIGECLKAGKEVWALVRGDSPNRNRLPSHPRLHPVWCGLKELGDLPNRILAGPDSGAAGVSFDTFYHLAWENTGKNRDRSTELQSKNITYTLEAVKAAKACGCSRFIGAGSQAEYGPKEAGPIGPETDPKPVTPYGVSKLSACMLSGLLCAELGMEWIWPRIFSVYGINEKETTMISSALRAFTAKEPMTFTAGENAWDFLYSKDAGRAYYLIGEKGRPGSIYCVGSGLSRPLHTYIRELAELAGWPEGAQGIGKRPGPDGPLTNLWADIGTLQADTGFVPEYSFAEGIREILAYSREKADVQQERGNHEKENIGRHSHL